MSMSRRFFAAGSLASIVLLAAPHGSAQLLETAEAIAAAIQELYGKIQEANFKENLRSDLDEIKLKLSGLNTKLDTILKVLEDLPEALKKKLIEVNNERDIARCRAYGVTILRDAQDMQHNKAALRQYLNQLAVEKNAVAAFSAFSSPWVGEIFAYEMVGCRSIRSRQLFNTAQKNTLAVLKEKYLDIASEKKYFQGKIKDYQNFCADNSNAFVGYQQAGTTFTNFYIQLNDKNLCLEGNVRPEFKVKGPNSGPNGEQAPVSTVFGGGAINGSATELRKEAFNNIARGKVKEWQDALLAVQKLDNAAALNQRLALIVEKQTYVF